MKRKFSLLLLAIVVLTFKAIAQKDAGLQSLLNANSELSLPGSVKNVSQKLNSKPGITKMPEEEGGGWGNNEYTWNTAAGLVVTTYPDSSGAFNIIWLKASGKQVLSGLPYGLVLHGTTVDECAAKFKNGLVEKRKLNPTDYPGTTSSYLLIIKKGKYYLNLSFDQSLKLEQIIIAIFNPDAAG